MTAWSLVFSTTNHELRHLLIVLLVSLGSWSNPMNPIKGRNGCPLLLWFLLEIDKGLTCCRHFKQQRDGNIVRIDSGAARAGNSHTLVSLAGGNVPVDTPRHTEKHLGRCERISSSECEPMGLYRE